MDVTDSWGILKTKDGKESFLSVELADFRPDDTWAEADYDAYCAMQEGVNYILEQLEREGRFIWN